MMELWRRSLIKRRVDELTVIAKTMRASDLMVDFIYVPPENSVEDTLEIMFKHNISAVLILNEDKLDGVATLRDFVTRVPWGKKSLDDIKIKDIMTKEVLSVHPEEEIKRVIELIYYRDIRIIPVVSEQLVRGIITRKELTRLFAERLGQRYRVLDLMTYRYNTCTIHESMDEVMKKIMVYGDKYLIVLDGIEVVGVLTLSDILKHLYMVGEKKCVHTVKSIMNPNPIIGRKWHRCDNIAKLMIKHRISALPVVEKELEGLIRLQDFFKVLEI
jgi:CBS domain-containing protein